MSPVRDAEHCADIVRQHARTFALAARLLPREKRRGTFALYAFCRRADDLVDTLATRGAERLSDYRRALDAALDGQPDDAVFREVAWTVERFGVPAASLHALIDGVGRDLAPVEYATWRDLEPYCAGVASTVGEMCTHVMGVDGGGTLLECALRRARILGVAMQLTNILRDVGEDAARGRCYLPEEDLRAFGVSREAVLAQRVRAADPRWRALMRFEIARARALYADAEPGIVLLAADARRCAAACARGYAEILNAIEHHAYDTIRSRAIVTPWRRASVLWQAWRFRTA